MFAVRWVIPILVVLAVSCSAEPPGPERESNEEITVESEQEVLEMPSIPLATLWYLLYGYDPATGDCLGGIESTVWLRPQDTVFLPEDGLYCSGDDDHIAYAIGKMKEAGIDTIWLSWLYNGDVDFDTIVDNLDFQAADATTLKIIQYLNLNEPAMKVAFLVEPFTIPGIDPDDVTIPQKQTVLDYIWDNYLRWTQKFGQVAK